MLSHKTWMASTYFLIEGGLDVMVGLIGIIFIEDNVRKIVSY